MKDVTRKTGTCQLCGGHNRKLRILAVNDFIGWACEGCCQQLFDSIQRRFCSTGEETEPGE